MSRITSPFAFLGRSKATSDDKDEDDKKESKSKAEEGDDEDDKKDKDKKDDDAKGNKGAKAEDDDDDKKDKKDEDDKDSKSSKSKASDEDDDESDTSAKKARARERGRIRAILTSPAGQADPVGAAHLALDTAMPRADAIGMLTAMQLGRDAMAASGGASRAGLGERMGGVQNPAVGLDGGASGGPSMADRIIAAGKKARGEA